MNNNPSLKTIVITGASSGIGKSIAQCMLNNDYAVYDLSRHGKTTGKIQHITTDVTCEESIQQAFSQIEQEGHSIDALVVCAGMGISGAAEFTTLHEAKKIFDVNFFGAFNCAKAAIPYLRKANNPKIIFISSVAADIAIPYQSFYSATKAALNSFAFALKNELRSFKIQISVVMPGDVQTNFTQTREKNEQGDDLYQGKISKAVSVMEKDETTGLQPIVVAKEVLRQIKRKHPKLIVTVGGKYKFFVFLTKILPAKLLYFLVGHIYG